MEILRPSNQIPAAPVAWRAARILFLVLFGAVPAVSVIWFRYWGTDFAQDPSLESISMASAIAVGVMALLFLATRAIEVIRNHWSERQCKEAVLNGLVALSVPFIFAGNWYAAMGGAFAYLLHQWSPLSRTTVVVSVQYSKQLGRSSCRYEAVLEHDSFFWQRRLCGISKEQHFLLERGGKIELTGTASKYGILVSVYGKAER